MDASYKRHSRRSHPNLQHLSLKPLTPHYPLPSTVPSSPPAAGTPTSYIVPTYYPQSPSLLSRSPSRSRPHRTSKSSQTLVSLDDPFPQQSSKSFTSLPHARTASSRRKSASGSDWLLQTASTIATTSAEQKGQLWLTTRASSTSLAIADSTPSAYEPLDTAYKADDEFSPISTRWTSRPQSRLASRRESRVGIMTPMGVRTPGERISGEIERDRLSGVEVDFVEEESEEEEGEEGEMRKIVWGRVGGWVDWAVGWMDFRIDGEGEEGPGGEEARVQGDDEINHPGNTTERKNQGKNGTKRRRKRDESDRINVPQMDHVGTVDVQPPKNEEGIWKDTAWLLSVAAKVIV